MKGGEIRVKKKLLDFNAQISDVKKINPNFSTCKVRVMYTGKNRNMSIITKDAVTKALPTIVGIPIVGEFSVENEDFKGHGGSIDLDSYKYIHTTKPYGFVPESATYEWEEVKTRDGSREYLTIDGCYLWTGRYEEAYSIIEKGKGQSMEIELVDGEWDEKEDAYRVDNFNFSALCILGDDVEPAFEDANITAYSLDRDSFKQEFNLMLNELKLSQEGEVNEMLKELLKKYSLKVEDLTAKGINFNEISEDELEAKIIEVFEIQVEGEATPEGEGEQEPVVEADPVVEGQPEGEPTVEGEGDGEPVVEAQPESEPEVEAEPTVDFAGQIADLEAQLQSANETINTLTTEVEGLREFKLNTEKAEHEATVQEMFTNFQLTEEDVKDLDIHAFSVAEIEDKCYAIIGRKMASKRNFSKVANEGKTSIKVPVSTKSQNDQEEAPYGGLFDKYNK